MHEFIFILLSHFLNFIYEANMTYINEDEYIKRIKTQQALFIKKGTMDNNLHVDVHIST